MNLRNAMILDDRMTPVLNGMVQSMNHVIEVMERMNKSINRSRSTMQNLNATSLNNAKQSLQNAANQANNLNNKLNQTRGAANGVHNALSPLQSFSINLTGLWSFLNILNMIGNKLNTIFEKNDQFISLTAKLNLINDGKQTTDQLIKEVLELAARTRSDLSGTGNLISRLGMSGSPAFQSTKDVLKFSELFNKTMVISGTDKQENAATLTQMSQAMGSGRLQGDEFRSISEHAPMFKSMLAQGLGVQTGALKKMSKDGELTAEKINSALLKMAPKIEKMFESMPWTFSQAVRVMETRLSGLLEYGEPVFNRLTEAVKHFAMWLQTERAQRAVQLLAHWFDVLFVSTMAVFNMIKPFLYFIIDHGEIFLSVGNSVITFIMILSSLVWITNMVKSAWIALGSALISNPFLLLISLIAAVVSGISYWWQTSLNFRILWIRWCGDIGSFFYNAISEIVRAIEWLTNKFIDLQKMLSNPIAIVWGDSMKSKVSNVSESLQKNLAGRSKDVLKWSSMWQDYEFDKAAKEMLKPQRPGMGMGFTPGKPIPVEVKGGRVSLDKNDIKYLKDLAMKEYALNVKQVNPKITAKFGDIHQTADVDEILYKIEQTVVNTSQTSLVH